jgi:hypothetical protein
MGVGTIEESRHKGLLIYRGQKKRTECKGSAHKREEKMGLLEKSF